jgi:hypothetical protein
LRKIWNWGDRLTRQKTFFAILKQCSLRSLFDLTCPQIRHDYVALNAESSGFEPIQFLLPSF